MPRPLPLAAAAALGYLAGTLPSADLAARMARERADLRSVGSGNPGAANAIAQLGAGWGYSVMAADIAKGAIAARIGHRVAGGPGAHLAGTRGGRRPLLSGVDRFPRRQGRGGERRPVSGHLPRVHPDRSRRGRRRCRLTPLAAAFVRRHRRGLGGVGGRRHALVAPELAQRLGTGADGGAPVGGGHEQRGDPVPLRDGGGAVSRSLRPTAGSRRGHDLVIGIVTDSNSQIPPELAELYGIEVVALTVTLDGVDYAEGVDLDADEFYARFENGTPTVSTSQPSPAPSPRPTPGWPSGEPPRCCPSTWRPPCRGP